MIHVQLHVCTQQLLKPAVYLEMVAVGTRLPGWYPGEGAYTHLLFFMLMDHALDIVGDQRADQHALQPVLCVSCHHPCHRLHLQLRLSRIVAGLTELQSDLRLSLMDCYCEWVGIKLHLQFTPSQYLSTTMSDRGHNAHLWS